MNLLPLDELNNLREEIQERFLLIPNPTAEQRREFREWCEDEILDLLLIAYTFGCEDANDMLGTEIAPTFKEMHNSIYKKVAGKDFAERIAEYAENGTLEDIMRVAETDAHRVYNEATMNTADEAYKETGKTIFKQWQTMMDDRVRDTHFYLEGVKVPLDAEFVTFDGDRAKAPGGFTKAENNVRCRCVLGLSTE